MKIISDMRLLLLAIWLGSAVFFIGVAQNAFAVLPQRELAGAVVNRNLSLLNLGGLAISLVLIATSLIGSARIGRVWLLWVERFLLVILAAACAVGQFVISVWLASLRGQMGRPIDEVAIDDPLRMQFDMLHKYSVWVLMAGMAASLIAFFILANRRFTPDASTKGTTNNPFDFSKEFRKS